MNADDFLPLEKKVLSGLVSCGVTEKSVSESTLLGVAVSGGADSVSLLLSLAAIFSSDLLRVITVNHGIRSKEESGGDAAFVSDLCKKLGVECKTFEIQSGKILKIANFRDKSKKSNFQILVLQ